jgi:hypothetical protein
VKIWTGYGSEHSSNLKMIGHFRDEEAAKAAAVIFERLGERVNTDLEAETYDVAEDVPDLSDAMGELLRELKMYSLGPADIENFAYEHAVERKGSDLILTTDEDNIGGFVKILVDKDAQIEIFSMHAHTPTGERKTEE